MSDRIHPDARPAGRLPIATSPARAFVRAILIAGLVTSVFVGLARMTLPGVSHYREEVAAWIGGSLGQRVEIGSLEAGWRGWTPELWVDDVRVIEPDAGSDRKQTLARFEHATITIDPLRTLTRGALVPSELTVRGASLAISRDASGRLSVAGLPSIEGASRPADEEDVSRGRQEMARWLLEQGRLRLISTHIVWDLDPGGRPPLTLKDVSMDVRRVNGAHQLDLALRLPGNRAGSVSVTARLDGDLREPTWTGTISGVADDVDLRAVPGIERLLGVDVGSGRARVRAQSTWRNGTPTVIDAQMDLSDASFGRERPLGVPVASARARARWVDDAWKVSLEDLTLTTSSGVWPRTSAVLTLRPARDDAPLRVGAEIGFLRLEDALPFAGNRFAERFPRWSALVEAEPRGEIHGLELSLVHGDAGTRVLETRGEFIDFSTATPVGSLPALDGVSGSLTADAAGGILTLWRGSFAGDFDGKLDEVARIGEVAGTVQWNAADGARSVEADALTITNDDLSVRVDGQARWAPDSSAPVLDAHISIDRADLAALNAYIPHAKIPKGLSRWLRHALIAGRLSEGEVRLAGDLGHFALDAEDVVVQARARVIDGEFLYARGWAPLEGVSGAVTLEGKHVHFDVTEGEIFDSTVTGATMDIRDVRLKPVIVEVDGNVAGTTEDAARYLRESPLGPKFKHFLDTVSAAGKSELAIDLTIPAIRGSRKEVRGVLTVSDNVVGLPGMSEGLQSVNGAFAFNGGLVTAEGVEARYLGRPITLGAGKLEGSRATRLRVEGHADADYLASHLHNTGLLPEPDPQSWVLTSRLSGETDWAAIIDVPHVVGRGATRARIRVESALGGVSSALPQPFDKAPDAPGGIVVETRFEASGDRLMRIDYGSVARAKLLLKPGLGRHRLHSGALRLGGASVDLPQAPGIVIDGHIERLSLADWLAIAPGAPTSERPRGTLIDEIRATDLSVRELEVAGLTFDHALMSGTKNDRGTWHFEIEGPHATGDVTVPKDFGIEGIDASFERLVFRPDEEARRAAAPDAVDPRALPPTRFTCRDCKYKDEPIGTIRAATVPSADGLRIDSLDIAMPHATVTASGTWTADGTVQQTYLDARGQASDIGALLGTYTSDEPPTSGGDLEVLLNASWPGSPGAFELSRVEGVLQMRAQEGRLMNLDPGAGGRFFQLISVTSLPRRLRLDFSDLTEEGLGYDTAAGTFTITNGNAFTEDLFIENEVARIDIHGRTGLAAEDYDQVVTITPRLTSSLPLAPIWLAEKVFNAQIFNKVFASRFTVTGSWEDPVVEKVIVEGVVVEGEK